MTGASGALSQEERKLDLARKLRVPRVPLPESLSVSSGELSFNSGEEREHKVQVGRWIKSQDRQENSTSHPPGGWRGAVWDANSIHPDGARLDATVVS
jgi:hypothetical protein